MRNSAGLIFLVLFINVTLVSAQDAPFDFKGIAIGSSIASIESDSRFACRNTKSLLADSSCDLKSGILETIAGAPIRYLTLQYYDGKLESMYIIFSENHFSNVAAALSEKYGLGTSKTKMVQNSRGASFENIIHTWRRNNATLEATRYSSKLDTSSVIFRTDFALEEFARRKKEADKKKAGDL